MKYCKILVLFFSLMLSVFSYAESKRSYVAVPGNRLREPNPPTEPAKDYIGLQYTRAKNKAPVSLPEECKDAKGRVEVLTAKQPLGLLSVICDRHHIIWLEEFIGLDENNKNNIEVKIADQLVLTYPLVDGQGFSKDIGKANNGCYIQGNRKTKPVVLIGIYSGYAFDTPGSMEVSEKLTIKNGGLIQGWILNAKNKKIEPASEKLMQSVVCYQVIG